jgi:hypothetical protein
MTRRYVRVRFTPYGKLYTYRCRGAAVGSLVLVPPNSYCEVPQLVWVAKMGRGWTYFGPLQTACVR